MEELLRQADQLISTQKPRAEVYAAMAETLGKAWRDVNDLLELRKRILDCNVLFQWLVDSKLFKISMEYLFYCAPRLNFLQQNFQNHSILYMIAYLYSLIPKSTLIFQEIFYG